MKLVSLAVLPLFFLASTPLHSALPREEHIAEVLSKRRQAFDHELHYNQKTLTRFLYLIDREVGTQGRKAQQMFVETVMNRADARRESIADVLTPAYYPPLRRRVVAVSASKRRIYTAMIDNALEGSNVSFLATDNASNQPGNRLAAKRKKQGRPGTTVNGEFFYVDRPYQTFFYRMKTALFGKGKTS